MESGFDEGGVEGDDVWVLEKRAEGARALGFCCVCFYAALFRGEEFCSFAFIFFISALASSKNRLS